MHRFNRTARNMTVRVFERHSLSLSHYTPSRLPILVALIKMRLWYFSSDPVPDNAEK